MADIIKARILACVPEYGMAVVQPVGGAGTEIQPRIATLPYGGSRVGCTVYHAYVEGTMVLCATKDNGNEFVCDIVGTYNDLYDAENTNAEGWEPVLDKLAKTNKPLADVITRLAGKHADRMVYQAAGVPADVLPGDYIVKDRQTGVGIEVRRQFAGLEGGVTARLRAFADGNVSVVGRSMSVSTPLGERVDAGFYAVDNRAASLSEAFGLRSGAPMKTREDGKPGLELSEDGALPLYRMQAMSGGLVGGYETVVSDFPEGDVHTADTPAPALARLRMSLAGRYSVAAAARISSVKTDRIPVLSQVGYGHAPEDGAFDDLREPYTVEEEQEGDEEATDEAAAFPDNPDDPSAAERDAALYHAWAPEDLLSDEYVGKLAAKLHEYGFVINKPEGRAGRIGGANVGAEYTADSVQLTDPVTGEPAKRYDTTSFITHEPDGSICICDGYGSEIRMSHGNIYISPALDLFLRPGRDLSVMAGRHQAYNSQGTLTLNTSDAAFIRAGQRLQVCANTAENADADAGLVIETRNSAADVVVRSAGSMSVSCAADLYVGRRGDLGGDAPGQSPPDRSGTVVLDAAGNGALYVRGGVSTLVEAGSVRACSIRDDDGTANSLVSMDGPDVSLAAGTLHAMSAVAVCEPASAVTVAVPRNGELKDVLVRTPGTSGAGLEVSGNAVLHGSMEVGKAVKVCEQLQARSLVSESGECGGLPPDISPAEYFKPVDRSDTADRAVAALALSNTVSDAVGDLQARDGLVCGGRYLEMHSFAFPDDYGVQADLTMPGMVWQEDATGRVWSEQEVKRADGTGTMCYPGGNVWERAWISMRASSTSPASTRMPLSEGYRTNN